MNTEYEKIVGNNIRKIREQAKMTQEILATKLQLSGCDITRSAVAKIEVGQRHIYPDEIRLIKMLNKEGYNIRAYNIGCMLPWMNFEPRTFEEIMKGANEIYGYSN